MRIANRALALLFALALVVLAVVFTIEVVAAVSGASPVIAHWHQAFTDGRHNTWADTGPRVTSAILVAIGAVLVLAQLVPRRVRRFPLSESADDVDAAMSRRGVAHALNVAATRVDGVLKAKTAVRRGSARTSVTVMGGAAEAVRTITAEVQDAVAARVQDLGLRKSVRARVKVRTTKDPS